MPSTLRILMVVLSACVLALARADESTASGGPALALARGAVPPGMTLRESSHFSLLTDAELDSADAVLRVLEAAYAAFQKSCASIGVQPVPLKHKLVAVLFREKDRYRQFSLRFKPEMPEWVAGYYDPVADRLVIYDLMSENNVRSALQSVQKRRTQLEQQARDAAPPGQGLASTGQPVDAARTRLDRDAGALKSQVRSSFFATVAHEASHGLFFDTDVQRRSVEYPFWIAEGLATSFEPTDAKDRDFGFHRDNERRRRTFLEAAQADRLVPLPSFVMQEAAPREDEGGEVGRLYAQAYMFTRWLARERPTELRLYLESLRDGSWSDQDGRAKRFESIFGPPEALERSWLRAEARAAREIDLSPVGERLRRFDRAPADAGTSAPAPASAPGR